MGFFPQRCPKPLCYSGGLLFLFYLCIYILYPSPILTGSRAGEGSEVQDLSLLSQRPHAPLCLDWHLHVIGMQEMLDAGHYQLEKGASFRQIKPPVTLKKTSTLPLMIWLGVGDDATQCDMGLSVCLSTG